MITFDASAQERLDTYLAQVRASLRCCPSVDPQDVERDIREHIECALEQTPQPIACEDLVAVLDKLGSPTQWVSEEEMSWWRKITTRLFHGPEDWRLSYFCFMMAAFGLYFLLTSGDGGALSAFVCFGIGFCFSRAAIARVGGGDRLPPGQKWLLYPPLLPVYAFVGFFLIAGPTTLLFVLADEFENSHAIDLFPWNRHDDLAYWPIAFTFIASLTGLWWFVSGTAHKIWPGLLAFLFRPFLDNIRPAAINAFIGLGVFLFLVGAAGCTLMLVFTGWYDFLLEITKPAAA